MSFEVLKYFGLRSLTWALTIFIGVTFILHSAHVPVRSGGKKPRSARSSRAPANDPQQMESPGASLRVQFGLKARSASSMFPFCVEGTSPFRFRPSLMSYPTPAGEIISTLSALHADAFCRFLTILRCGQFHRSPAGFRKDKRSSKIMEGIAICIYPIPYFIIALVLRSCSRSCSGGSRCKRPSR